MTEFRKGDVEQLISKVEDVCSQIHGAISEGNRDNIQPDLIAVELERGIHGYRTGEDFFD